MDNPDGQRKIDKALHRPPAAAKHANGGIEADRGGRDQHRKGQPAGPDAGQGQLVDHAGGAHVGSVEQQVEQGISEGRHAQVPAQHQPCTQEPAGAEYLDQGAG